MTVSRARTVMRLVRNANPAKLHELYMEVYGAEFARLPLERARESIVEACAELLEQPVAVRKVRQYADAPEPLVDAGATVVGEDVLCGDVLEDDLPPPPEGIL